MAFYIQERVSENGQPAVGLERRVRSRRSSVGAVPELVVRESVREGRLGEEGVHREILCSICYLLTTRFCE